MPHSEIHGSKPITGSPWLIAGYHVLHRLLLPRHPPNALIALDLIQKKTSSFRSKVTFPAPALVQHRNIWLVYLTWTISPRRSDRQPHPHSGTTAISFATLFTMSKARPIGRSNLPSRKARWSNRGADRSERATRQPSRGVVERIGIEPMTPCLQSRCSPS